MDYWPDVVISEDLRSPAEILQEAAEELEKKQSILTVEVHKHNLADRISLAFMVKNRRANAKVILLEALHDFQNDYPVALHPNTPTFPDFLKRKRVVKHTPIEASVFEKLKAKTEVVENKWVCSTPAELEKKLKELLSDDATQVVLLNLLRMPEHSAAKPDDSIQDSGTEEKD